MKQKFAALTLFLFALSIPLTAQTNSDDPIRRSVELERQGKPDEAIAEISKAISAQPDNAQFYLRRANIYSIHNKMIEALQDANKAVSLRPDDKNVISQAASMLGLRRQCRESLDIINTFISKHGVDDRLYYLKYADESCLGDLVSAFDDLSKAIELEPNNSVYNTQMPTLLAKMGDSEGAAERLNTLIKNLEARIETGKGEAETSGARAELARVYDTRANIHHQKADHDAEFADLAKSVQYDTRGSAYKIRANTYIFHKMYVEAIADLTEAIKASPFPATVYMDRGIAYAQAKKYEEAVRDFDKAAELDPILKNAAELQKSRLKERIGRAN